MVTFGGECLTYRLGNMRRAIVKAVEAKTASVKRASSMMTQTQRAASRRIRGMWARQNRIGYHRIRCDAIADDEDGDETRKLRRNLGGMLPESKYIIPWCCRVKRVWNSSDDRPLHLHVRSDGGTSIIRVGS